MTDMKMNPDTGLPELPDGQVWRVKHSLGQVFDPPGWYIQIETEPGEPRWSHWMPPERMIIGEDFWDTEYRQVPDRRTWSGKQLFRTEKRVLTSPQPVVVAAAKIESWDDHPTKAEVRRTAIELLESLEKREAAQKLIGVYPPNNLED